MTSDVVMQIIGGLILASITGVTAILFADQKTKGRHEDNSKRIGALEEEKKLDIAEHAAMKATVSMLANQLDRLDDQKASKEVVDGFRREISELKFDMDRRFDKLERLIIRLSGKGKDEEQE